MRVKLAGVCLIAAALALATSVPAQDGTPTTITDIRQESDERSVEFPVSREALSGDYNLSLIVDEYKYHSGITLAL